MDNNCQIVNVTGAQLPKYIGYEVFLSFGHNDHSWETLTEAVPNNGSVQVILACNISFSAGESESFQVRPRAQQKTLAPYVVRNAARTQPSERDFMLSLRAEHDIQQPHYPLSDLYRGSLAGLTDEYQIAMAYAHFLSGHAEREGVFHYYFRTNPFKGGYAVACGLTHLVDYLMHYRWTDNMLQKVANCVGNDGKPLYRPDFVEYLANMRNQLNVDAVAEGTVIFANEPVVRVSGPIIQGQLLESALLNLNNFPTLCATKAARIVRAANGKPVSDQSLRRDQGVDGSITACWATYVGGFSSTSNFFASDLLGIPSKGTMAHALIMAHATELEAFLAYADALPNNCVFLVDTYNSIEGVKKAIKVGLLLRDRGNEMIGVRLDSGDLAYLSREARRMLDEAGFPNAKVFVSNDLDEHIIQSLNQQGACIDVYGVGTKVGTCYDQPALGGVYKLGAVRDNPSQPWRFPVKLSEQAIKVSTPGIQQIRRFLDANGRFLSDMIFNEADAPVRAFTMVDQLNDTRQRRFTRGTYGSYVDLLRPIFRDGRCVYQCPSLPEIQAYAAQQLACLDDSIKRFQNPHEYPVGLEKKLYTLKKRLIRQARRAA